MNNKGTVLVIDDERDLVELVRYNLERAGYDVIGAADGATGFDIATEHKPDLIVLDLMMPGIDGLEVCRRLRGDSRSSRIPVIMLTAKAEETDLIVGLEMGADDYVTKPFSPKELAARVKAVLRRGASGEPTHAVRVGHLTIDPDRHEVKYKGVAVALTATEFRILQFMARRPGRVVARDEIIDAALGRDANVFDRTVDVHITAIRKKLGAGGELIETIRGFGYRLKDQMAAEPVS